MKPHLRLFSVILQASVEIPKVDGKITRRKKNEHVYVFYEISRTYDPKRKFNVPKRVTIGKVDPKDENRMFPNDNFVKYFPDTVLSEEEAPRAHSNTLRVGTFFLLEKIIKGYGLQEKLAEQFGSNAGLILDLTLYMIITQDNAARYYPDYARNHPLFTSNQRVVSDSTISRLLADIDEDQITAFLDDWNRNRDHKQRVYLSYDCSNKNCQAGDVDFAEFGRAKDDKGLPIVNLSVVYDKDNQVPLLYEIYPGSINDVSQLQYLVDKLHDYNYRNIGLILDRGYFSRKNIEYMDQKGYSFLLMVKGCKNLVSEFVDQNRGTFEGRWSSHIAGTQLDAITIKHPLYIGDRERYFHLYFSEARMAAERAQLYRNLEQMQCEMQKMTNREYEFDGLYEHYFDCHYQIKKGQKIFLFAKQKEDVIETELALCGYFCMVSTEEMTAEEAYWLYRGRDASEKLFCADKSFLGSRSLRVHSNDSVRSKIFIEFIALIVRNRLYNLLNGNS